MLVVKYNVKYDNIGGKVFQKERNISKEEIESKSKDYKEYRDFIFRRDNFFKEQIKYYIGRIPKNRRDKYYILAEDELWEV